MNEEQFRKFLKKGGRNQTATDRCITCVKKFQEYLNEFRGGKSLDDVVSKDLEVFVEWADEELEYPFKTKTYLWAIKYYYEFINNKKVWKTANELRKDRIEKVVFPLNKFRGVDKNHVDKLRAAGIKNVKDMLKAGKTKKDRKELAKKSGVPLDTILELVKLSDLARINGIKAIRARLYYDAGVDTIEKMAQWDPEKLRNMLLKFVKKTNFDGIAPLYGEAEYSIKTAKKLPKIVEY